MARRPAKEQSRYVARNIRRIRAERNMTQAMLAKDVGTSVPYISQVESGGVNTSLEYALTVAEALGVGIADLLAPCECDHMIIKWIGDHGNAIDRDIQCVDCGAIWATARQAEKEQS